MHVPDNGARVGQRRSIRGSAAFAFPAGVPTTRASDDRNNHVPRKQPVATLTPPGRGVHPLGAGAVLETADVNTHRNTVAPVVRRCQCGVQIVMNCGRSLTVSL